MSDENSILHLVLKLYKRIGGGWGIFWLGVLAVIVYLAVHIVGGLVLALLDDASKYLR